MSWLMQLVKWAVPFVECSSKCVISLSWPPIGASVTELNNSWLLWTDPKKPSMMHQLKRSLFLMPWTEGLGDWGGRHVSDSKAVLFTATKQVCVSWACTFLPPRKQKQMACEESQWKPGRAGEWKPQILPKSRSLGTLRGHAESQLLLGAGEGGKWARQLWREKGSIERPVLCWSLARPRTLTCII